MKNKGIATIRPYHWLDYVQLHILVRKVVYGKLIVQRKIFVSDNPSRVIDLFEM